MGFSHRSTSTMLEVLMTEVNSRSYTLATFYEPGSLFAEEWSQEVSTRDPYEIAKLAPKRAFCFVLRDYVDKKTVVDGDTFEKTEPLGESTGRYYLGGSVYTIDEMKAKFGSDRDRRILISNMENNNWLKVIQCPSGNWQPFTEKDELLEAA
jgi:hypothetical protein